jgi:two-component system, response regulator PdtaR
VSEQRSEARPRPVALVVEDEFLIARELELLLTNKGWDVLGPANSVAGALELLRNDCPDIAVLDLNVLDGMVTRVAEALKSRGVPFVIASGHDPGAVDAPVLSDAPWLAKPLNGDSLVSALRRLLDLPMSDRER